MYVVCVLQYIPKDQKAIATTYLGSAHHGYNVFHRNMYCQKIAQRPPVRETFISTLNAVIFVP